MPDPLATELLPGDASAAAAAFLRADELLAGSRLQYEVAVPAALVQAGAAGTLGQVRLRPLTVADLQLITRAARANEGLVAALMVRAAVEEPQLTMAQVNAMPIGLMEFLLAEVNRVSGLAMAPQALEAAAAAPIARAAHLLARQFG